MASKILCDICGKWPRKNFVVEAKKEDVPVKWLILCGPCKTKYLQTKKGN